MPHLVLLDIDHTLADTRGVVRELSTLAFEEVTGHSSEVLAAAAAGSRVLIGSIADTPK